MKTKTHILHGVLLFALATLTPLAVQAATFTVTVDGDTVYSQSLAATEDSDGSTRYTGATADSAGQWDLTWNIDTIADPTVKAGINGALTYINSSAATQIVTMDFAMPICPAILNTSNYYAFLTVALVNDADGGMVSVPEGALFSPMADGAAIGSIFAGGFLMGSSGASNNATSQALGSAGTPLAGPAVSSSMGMHFIFSLTPGEKLTLGPSYSLLGETSGADCTPAVIVSPVTGPSSPTTGGVSSSQGGDVSSDAAAAGGCQHSSAQSPLGMVLVLLPFALIYTLKRSARA